MDNPFEYGRELGPGELADREAEVAEAGQTLTSGAKEFLIGPRRYGKSSVHNVASHKARDAGAIVLRHNVEAYADLEALLSAIVADAAKAITGPVERVARRLAEIFKHVRPQVTYSPLDPTWSVSLGSRAGHGVIPQLVDVLNGLESLAARSDRPVGLVLDEIQHLVADGADAERQLRAAVQEHRHVGYLFAGSDTRLLTAMTSDSARPFYRLGLVRMLEEIPRPAFHLHLAAGFAPLGAQVPERALDAILDEADDVPYNVQLLAHECWNDLRDAGPNATLSVAQVHALQARSATRLDPVYSQIWLGLTAPQRRALQAAVLEGGDGLFSKGTLKQFNMTAASMQRAIDGLIGKRTCWRQSHLGTTRLRLEDPLFGCWIRQSVGPPSGSA